MVPLFVLLLSIFQACQGANMVTPPSGGTTSNVKYSCAGQSVSFPWDYTLSSTERVEDIQWHFVDNHNQLIAIYADSHFVPLPAFVGRVEMFGNAGLKINNVKLLDTGNYSVTISVHDNSGSFATLGQTLFLQIGDTLMTQDGYLHAVEEPTAVKDPKTGVWAIQLSCGTFTYRADPPFELEWSTPSSMKSSTSYEANKFKLLVDNPVEGGNYTCKILPQDYPAACLTANQGHLAQATTYVDKVLARLKILESENIELKQVLGHLNSTCLCPP